MGWIGKCLPIEFWSSCLVSDEATQVAVFPCTNMQFREDFVILMHACIVGHSARLGFDFDFGEGGTMDA